MNEEISFQKRKHPRKSDPLRTVKLDLPSKGARARRQHWSIRDAFALLIAVLVGVVVLLFCFPRLVKDVAPGKLPVEPRQWHDSYGLPYKSRGPY